MFLILGLISIAIFVTAICAINKHTPLDGIDTAIMIVLVFWILGLCGVFNSCHSYAMR